MTPQQCQQLKTKAHPLKPVVMLGQHGLTESVLAAIEEALTAHELIKIKLPGDKQSNQQLIDTICSKLEAQAIQTVGRVGTIYRQKPQKD